VFELVVNDSQYQNHLQLRHLLSLEAVHHRNMQVAVVVVVLVFFFIWFKMRHHLNEGINNSIY